MADFFEVDFIDVKSKKSGDAIALRYELDGVTSVHAVDGGYQDTGDQVVEFIGKYYGSNHVDNVIVTHPDGDHAAGLSKVLDGLDVEALWMHRPWLYSGDLIDRFSRFTSVESLTKRLKEIYPNIAALEEIAEDRGIPIFEPFQGAVIGEFTVLAPTKNRFLDLVVESDKTPESVSAAQESLAESMSSILGTAFKKAVNFIKAAWGVEVFSTEGTSAENEMSVIQAATLCGELVVLTGDAGREGLAEAADYASYAGIELPGVNRFQIPHHGSRRNVSTEVLDRWLGPQLSTQLADGEETFSVAISASKEDEHHPRKSVVRAAIHRGARVVTTEGSDLCWRHGSPPREGYGPAINLPYPDEQED